MGHFYFARHGQTVWNVENKICGATDIELTELGHQQAEELGQAILEQEIQIDEILYSPLIRAKETARHVSEVTGIPMREEMRLKEQNFGKYEGKAREVLEALLDKYAENGILDFEKANILEIPPFNSIGKPTKIIKLFGGKVAFEQAIRELEYQIYKSA